jgi:protein-tyrosine phosphatase
LQGAINFRDLGGYSTNVGKQVKWGKIYRSADISKLTDKDLKTLTELNIKFECDLRGEKEYEAAPDKLPDGIERIALPAGSENVSPGMSGFIKYMKSEATADSMIMAMYSKTDHFQKKYKPMFDRLLSLGTDEALMFHCTAGKDRTGIGAALILYALGVNENTIYDDYEATNIYRESSNKQYIKALTAYGISEKAAQKLMAADRKYLKATFDSLKKQYGSVEFFLQSEMGLTMNNLKILREKYLY